ncbi:MAG: DNA primase [Bacilli bacterium]|nr:DNA primase [Bacilli bacterium]
MNPNDLTTEIRNKVDIVDIIGERIPLTAKGRNFFGVCPFHDDTNPSMSVSREKQIYKCFSCGASGNVYTFLMNYEHKEFKEVLQDLGKKVGIHVSGVKVNQATTKYDSLYEAYRLSVKYYQNNLASSYGKEAKEYLHHRGIPDEIIKEFEIGLSLSGKKDLTTLLTTKKYELKILNQIGLSIDDRDIYIDRIMFPLHDSYGKVVGFSGRIYRNVNQSKYINTKETVIFKKGDCLYHYHAAIDFARISKSIIVMEGFMDVIRAFSIGIKNTVALMGTALTKEQLRLIKRLSQNIILCLDGDGPGRHAALKIGQDLVNDGIEPRVITLPNEDDPDSYILKNGKEKFIDLIESAVFYSDYKIASLKENINFNSEEDLSSYIHSVILEATKIEDEIRVEIILKKLAKDYNIGYNTLEKRFRDIKENLKPTSKIEVRQKEKKRSNKYILAMEQVIFHMLNHPWVINLVEQEKIVFPNNETRILTNEIIYFYRKNRYITIADFYTYLQDKTDLLSYLEKIVSSNVLEDVTKDDLFAYFKVIKDYSKSQEIKRLERLMKKESDCLEQAKIVEQIRKLKLGEI